MKKVENNAILMCKMLEKRAKYEYNGLYSWL